MMVESTLMFASHGDQIGLAKLVQGSRSTSNGHYISTKAEGNKSIKLKVNEIVLQVIKYIYCYFYTYSIISDKSYCGFPLISFFLLIFCRSSGRELSEGMLQES